MVDRTKLRAAIAGVVLAGAVGCGGTAGMTGADGGGGHAGGGGLPADASVAQGVALLPIESRQTIPDPRQPVFYLAATSNSPTNPKSVVALSATTGAVLWATPLPFEPGHVAVSDDGSTLYVNAWAPETQVARLNLSSHAIELTFSLPKSPTSGGQYQPQDIAVIPGAPHAAVVSMRDDVVFQAGLAAFDDANMRPRQPAELGQFRIIVHPGAAGTFYGLGGTGGPFMAFTVDAQGVGTPMAGSPPGSLGGYARYFSYDGELIFSNDGIVLNPVTGATLGMYDGDPAAVAVDRPAGRSYLAMPPPIGETTGKFVVLECDRLAFTPLRKLTVNLVGAAYRMVRATDGTLALDALVETDNKLVLIQPSAWSNATAP